MSESPSLESEAPVFLVGAPRSGTSLVYKALCVHRDASYISNWVRLFPAIPQLAVLNRAAVRLPELRRRAWFGGGDNAYVYGSRRPLWQRAFPMPVEGEPLYARAGVGVHNCDREVRGKNFGSNGSNHGLTTSTLATEKGD